MESILKLLRAEFADYEFDGGDRAEGFWIRVTLPDGSWTWERNRMASPETILETVRQAIRDRV